MLIEFVSSERFASMIRGWTSSEIEEFTDLLLTSRGPNSGDTRWAPLIQILIADLLASLRADVFAVKLHAQASGQGGIVPDLGSLRALAATPSIPHLPEETWSRVPINASWNSDCDLSESWREFLNFPPSAQSSMVLTASCSCGNKRPGLHQLRILVERPDSSQHKEFTFEARPSAELALELLDVLGSMTGRPHGFEVMARGEEKLLRISRKIRGTKLWFVMSKARRLLD
jgi:hypothetical protein